jgi:archaellum biogenesis protein FlaJ (TadC family)
MNRRGFLKSLGALATVAASAAATAAVPNILFAPNKYAESLRLLDLTIAAKDDIILCNNKMDELFVYLRANFTAPEANQQNIMACRVILRDMKYEELEVAIRKIPPLVADDIYPIALTRQALVMYNLPVHPCKMKEFDWFHKTYGKIILQGAS